jgi:hypothetical protein
MPVLPRADPVAARRLIIVAHDHDDEAAGAVERHGNDLAACECDQGGCRRGGTAHDERQRDGHGNTSGRKIAPAGHVRV